LNTILRIICLLLCSPWPFAEVGFAHDGPPLPILVNWQLATLVVNVWSDPDVGQSRIDVVVQGPGIAAKDLEFTVEVQPVSGVAESQSYRLSKTPGYEFGRYSAYVEFSKVGEWRLIFSCNESGRFQQAMTIVPVSSPSIGMWSFVWYLSPFIAFGSLWILAFCRPTKRRSEIRGATQISRENVAQPVR
jgi:hypothetical protein